MFDPYILHIDTATEVCSVSLSKGPTILQTMETAEPNQHAARLTLFVEALLKDNRITGNDLAAIAVSMGPGSYTGLRIGVSTAKGLCYGLDLPLIGINTLESMFEGYKNMIPLEEDTLYFPMIDARRMEVYTSVWNSDGDMIRPTSAEIMDENSFEAFEDSRICLFGSGAAKLEGTYTDKLSVHIDKNYKHSSASMCALALKRFEERIFEDLVYFEPFYLKEFVATQPKRR